MGYADTGTCATPGSQKSFTIEDFGRAADMIRCMPPEPIGQWMRSQGYLPEQWVLVIPEKMLDSEMLFLPSYVRGSSVIDKPVFVRKFGPNGN